MMKLLLNSRRAVLKFFSAIVPVALFGHKVIARIALPKKTRCLRCSSMFTMQVMSIFPIPWLLDSSPAKIVPIACYFRLQKIQSGALVPFFNISWSMRMDGAVFGF